VERDHPTLSIARQCKLLSLNRSTLYYEERGESLDNIGLMTMIDEQFTETPFYGSRRMAKVLSRKLGISINRKRVARLMKIMGIAAIFPGPNTSAAHPRHKKYPYLLRDVEITRRDQVWSTDITYVRLKHGFAYLVAVIDWHSRYVLSWRLSNTMDTSFCIDALNEALSKGTPEVFNTDQGSQFTSEDFLAPLIARGISISMDGRGRALDNIFVERLWRSVKYEDIYPKGYETISEARRGLAKYFELYNQRRPHQSLSYQTPAEVHYGSAA
jgi:putative transposase